MLVNNINLHPISHCFQIIADYWSNMRFCFWQGVPFSTSIYWHSCGLKAEQLDKTRKGLKTCKQHNKPTKW